MTASNMSTLSKLAKNLTLLSEKQASGEWLLNSSERQWKFCLYQGYVFYATDDLHRVRCWQRAIKLNCPNFAPDMSSLKEPWEYNRLHFGLIQKQLTIPQAKAVIRTTCQEVLFYLSTHYISSSRWVPYQKPIPQIIKPLLLSPVEIEQLIKKTTDLSEQWKNSGLEHISPQIAPVFKQSATGQNTNLEKLLNGENTIWDIAYQMRRNAITVALSLLPLIRRGIIELKEIPDLALPIAKKSPASVSANPSNQEQIKSATQPLIACIDDSPMIGQTLEKILIPAGYRLLKITEPLRQMSTLVKHKPDLIFLDLVMPDASGYNICSFLRKTPLFQKTPIIILTSRDTVVNRGQAKLTGATSFLNKPPDPQKVLQIIQKYLGVNPDLSSTQDTSMIGESMTPSLGGA